MGFDTTYVPTHVYATTTTYVVQLHVTAPQFSPIMYVGLLLLEILSPDPTSSTTYDSYDISSSSSNPHPCFF